MGANKFFFSQFRRGISLIADYQFNNNLIDDANGYNLIGTNITYDNGNAVFNGTTSEASRTDTNDIFSFTDGVKDLPFRIETSVKFNSFTNQFQFILSKRDGNLVNLEWQINFDNANSQLQFNLFSVDSNGDFFGRLRVQKQIIKDTNAIYDIVIEYDGSKNINGLSMLVNGVSADIFTSTDYIGMTKSQSSLLLGRAGWDSNPTLKLDGQIDYLKIYK